MNYKNVWLMACFGASAGGGLINVKFKGRDVADFPRASFDDLKSDPNTEWIADDETGEILFSRD